MFAESICGELAQGRAVETRGELKQDDPVTGRTELRLSAAGSRAGRLQVHRRRPVLLAGHEARTVVTGKVRRQTTPVETPLATGNPGRCLRRIGRSDDPDSYPVASDATEIDVTPAVREELVLARLRVVECRDDARESAAVRKGPERRSMRLCASPDARWQPLKALKDDSSVHN